MRGRALAWSGKADDANPTHLLSMETLEAFAERSRFQ
jgi:hypothetical protein